VSVPRGREPAQSAVAAAERVSMRLHVLSDLHLEKAPLKDVDVDVDADADVVVLAGDTDVGTRGIAWARKWADGRRVLYVAGNHEFYGGSLPGVIDAMRSAADGSGIHVLENDEVVLDGVRFLGCTLWSDFEFNGPEGRHTSMRLSERVVNDYSHITYGPRDRRLQPADTRMLHISSRAWLAGKLAEPFEGETVVITHHQPVIRSRPDNRILRSLAGAFASDVSELMDGERTRLWIYGHTHRAADLDVNGTRLLSNPRGYPHEPVAEFNPGLVVDV
jgi:predicted phosphodiesterase